MENFSRRLGAKKEITLEDSIVIHVMIQFTDGNHQSKKNIAYQRPGLTKQ